MKTRVAILALLIAIAGDCVWAACPSDIVKALAKDAPAYRDLLISYWKNVPKGSAWEEGLMIAVRGGNASEDGVKGAQYATGIIETFTETSQQQFERLSRLKNAINLEKQIPALGSRDWNRVNGVNAELRFADERITPSKTKAFQYPPLEDTIPDIQDVADNLYEIKYRSWTNATDIDDITSDFARILKQATAQQQAAAAQGKMFTLAFEQRIPSNYVDLFEGMFYDLATSGNVVIIDGF